MKNALMMIVALSMSSFTILLVYRLTNDYNREMDRYFASPSPSPVVVAPTPMVNVIPGGVAILDLEAGYYLDTRLQGQECINRGGRPPRDGYGCEISIDKSKMVVMDPNNPPAIVIGGK